MPLRACVYDLIGGMSWRAVGESNPLLVRTTGAAPVEGGEGVVLKERDAPAFPAGEATEPLLQPRRVWKRPRWGAGCVAFDRI